MRCSTPDVVPHPLLPRAHWTGNYTVSAAVVDAAGNPSESSSTWFVVDVFAPLHNLSKVGLLGCVSHGGVVSCNNASTAQFNLTCWPEASSLATAPCYVQWALSSFTSSSSWTSATSSSTLVDFASSVDRMVTVHPTSRFVLTSRAVDAAGNIGAEMTYEWWVDISPPGAPAIVSGPDTATVSTAATFVVKLPTADASPGQLSFDYDLYVASSGVSTLYDFSSGKPRFTDPTPVNSAPCTLALPALMSGDVYTLVVAAVTQVSKT